MDTVSKMSGVRHRILLRREDWSGGTRCEAAPRAGDQSVMEIEIWSEAAEELVLGTAIVEIRLSFIKVPRPWVCGRLSRILTATFTIIF